MKGSFIFYSEYEDALACIKDDAERLKALEALIRYGLHGEKEDVDGVAGVVLNMAIPMIDANKRRYEQAKENGKFGKLGGRPKKVREEVPQEEEAAQEEEPKREEAAQEEKRHEEQPVQEEPKQDAEPVEVPDEDAQEAATDEPVKEKPKKPPEQKKPPEPKKCYGEYKRVRLTKAEFDKLIADYGEDEALEAIDYFDKYIVEKGYIAKSHYLAMRRWVFDALDDRRRKKQVQNFNSRPRNFVSIENRREDMQELERQLVEN